MRKVDGWQTLLIGTSPRSCKKTRKARALTSVRDASGNRDSTRMKVVVKGILTAEDAKLCVENGVDEVIVSNHGARGEDSGGATIDVLPEVVRGGRPHSGAGRQRVPPRHRYRQGARHRGEWSVHRPAPRTHRRPARLAVYSASVQAVAPAASRLAISDTWRPWKRASESSFSLGRRDPSGPASVVAP